MQNPLLSLFIFILFCILSFACLPRVTKLSLSIGREKFEEAEQIAKQACEKIMTPKGCFYLGFKLQQESKPEESNKYYEKACGLNFAVGCLSLANNYRQGLGVNRDPGGKHPVLSKSLRPWRNSSLQSS